MSPTRGDLRRLLRVCPRPEDGSTVRLTVVRGFEIAAWAVFWVGIVTMLVRGAYLREAAQKYRTGWILA